MYKLYFSPGACSLAVHVTLNECGVQYEPVNTSIKEGKNKSPEFLKINPRGQIPVLADDDLIIREGGAILTYLCDKEKSPLMPASGPERGKALEWLMWCNASLHPAYSRFFWLNRAAEEGPQKQALVKMVIENIQSYWTEAETRLSQNKYLAGSNLTVGDILMTVIADWNGWLPQPIQFGPNVSRVLKEVSSRPAYQKAMQAEGLSAYKAAA